MSKRYNDLNEFTWTLAVSLVVVIYLIYPELFIEPLSQGLGMLKLIKFDHNKSLWYTKTYNLSIKYKHYALILFYVFYFLFIYSRKQKKKAALSHNDHILISIALIICIIGSSFAFWFYSPENLSLKSGSTVSILSTIMVLAVLPFAALFVSSLKTHSLKEKGIRFIYNRRKASRSDNLIFSLFTADGWINYKNVFQGFFGSGGAGSGKSVSLVEPFLWQIAEKNLCGLIFDFKNWELTTQIIAFKQYHQRKLLESQEKWDNGIKSKYTPKWLLNYKPHGFLALLWRISGLKFLARFLSRPKAVIEQEVDIKVIDFMRPDCSHRVNFLQPRIIDNMIKVDSVIKKFLTALSPEDAKKKDIWFNGSVALFKGGLLYFKKYHPEYCTFPHITTFLTMIDTESIKMLFNRDDDVKMVSDVYMKAPEKTAGSIAASLSSSLSQLSEPNIYWVLSGDDIHFDLNSKDNPTLLCLVTDEEFAQSLSPLASIISKTCLDAMNKKGRYPSMALFDEFPQIYIQDIDRLPATCRSNKVGIMCVIQDLAQLLKEYGDKDTKALCANLLNKVYFKATDIDTQKAMVDLFGDVTKIKESQSRGEGDGSSNFSEQKEKYLNPEDVLNFTEGEGVGVKSTGKKERRYHSRFRTLFSIHDGEKKIKGTGYPKMPNMKNVMPEEKQAIPFNKHVTQKMVMENFEKIKQEINTIVKQDIDIISPMVEEEQIAQNANAEYAVDKAFSKSKQN